jgi:hypothetical protein
MRLEPARTGIGVGLDEQFRQNLGRSVVGPGPSACADQGYSLVQTTLAWFGEILLLRLELGP